ncbi:hypothetical protein [Pricia antarctica]|uniref:hypothetical protein n=1 Tax=Pricia antarctica TaxID=641691 RepID=UPI000B826B58|nr:hypothetical protein [Pricia antarctica]
MQTAYAQQPNYSLPDLYLAKIVQVSQSDSYITFPTDIGYIEPLMFETNVNPSLTFESGRNRT